MRSAIVLGLALLPGTLGLAGCSSAPSLSSIPTLRALDACGPDRECPPVADRVLDPGELVPVYKTVEEPIYEERRTPIWAEKTVAVYRTRKVPVTITLPDGCTGCDRQVKLWDKEEDVQVGVRRVPACIGYKVERVKVGSCPKQVLVGWEPEAPEPACPPPPACPPAR